MQKPINEKDCRVIGALLSLMSSDPNWQVRNQALSSIKLSKFTLLNGVIDRVGDENYNVRRNAIVILSEKALIESINLEKKLFILSNSLKDKDSFVLDICCRKLLPSWLAHKDIDNDLCKLLQALDVVNATETAELIFNSMFKKSSIETIADKFIGFLNQR
jgi:hypothetical protein